MEKKRCSKCGYGTEFGKNISKADGLQSYCIDCTLKYDRKYRKDNKDRIKIKEYKNIDF